MASAKIVEIIPVPPPKRVILDLSMEEAVTLLTVTDYISGSPNSRRSDTASIKDALLKVGVKSNSASIDTSKVSVIFFRDY